LLRDEKLAYYLKFESLRLNLTAICNILQDPQLSGEESMEGRRDIALRKLRDLRVGGREANELVEEFATRLLELLDEAKE
jgi:hypothetical protein